MKAMFGALGAGFVAAALLASPAQAESCVWNSHSVHCWTGQHYRHHQRAEIRHDRRHFRHLQAKLRRDRYFGSSEDLRHDRRAVRHARRELREDLWGD